MAGKQFRAINSTRGIVLVENDRVAASLWERAKGLLGQRTLTRGSGLLLRGEQAIHSIGMRFAFDAIFLNKQNRVVRIENAMPPFRLTPFVFSSANVMEMPAGVAAETETRVGDQIDFSFS